MTGKPRCGVCPSCRTDLTSYREINISVAVPAPSGGPAGPKGPGGDVVQVKYTNQMFPSSEGSGKSETCF